MKLLQQMGRAFHSARPKLELPIGIEVCGYWIRSRIWNGGITYSLTVEARYHSGGKVHFPYFNVTKKEAEEMQRRLDDLIKEAKRPPRKKK
jgi:hypothetical protein